jgi:8-oxo-dGTP pyrophosphatase MutT (NUDIX family)
MALARFDPERLPALPVPDEPPVDAERLVPQALRRHFAAPPPWQPEIRQEPNFSGKTVLRDAAVLVALVERGSQLNVLLTQRSAHLHDHAGQVSFAGGRRDDADAGPVATALREAEEEIGLERRHVDVLGELPVYVTGTAYRVTPVVALVRPPFELRLDPFEVESAFEAPLGYLMDPRHHRLHEVEFDGQRRRFYSMPYETDGRRYFIWGATAAMLRNLYRLLRA